MWVLCFLVFAGGEQHNTPEGVVRALQKAFNDHEVDAMTALVDEAVVWIYLQGEKVTVETRGKPALADYLSGYFKSLPSARSEIEDLLVQGPFVAVRERAHWQTESGPKSQTALAVYEIRQGKVLQVCYHLASP